VLIRVHFETGRDSVAHIVTRHIRRVTPCRGPEAAAMLERRTAETFVELADTLVAGFDIIELLQTLAERCVDLLQADAAAILLADQPGGLVPADQPGRLMLAASSTEDAGLLELFQLQAEEGPALDCYRSSHPVVCSDLDRQPERWPRFTAAAQARGFAAVQTLPMRLRAQSLGALSLFGPAPGILNAETLAIAQALADVATIGILHERTLRASAVVTGQLQAALTSRIVIEQAKGVLAERRQVTVPEAFTLMRGFARDRNRKLSEVAQSVIDQAPQVTELLYPADNAERPS
jgi:hypothetical protein